MDNKKSLGHNEKDDILYMNTNKKPLIILNNEECANNLNDFFIRIGSQNDFEFATAIT